MTEATQQALLIAKNQGMTFINPYDHPDVIAGNGTIGLEILEQVPNPDAVILTVGGGGMIAGVATAIKTLSPNTKIIVRCIESFFDHKILKFAHHLQMLPSGR